MKSTFTKSALMATVMVALVTGSARANTIIPSFVAFTSGTSITYEMRVSSGELHPGDGFTIFDVGGYTGVLATPAVPFGPWTAGTSFTGSPFGPATTPDNGTLANVHFFYGGSIVEWVGFSSSYVPFTIGTNAVALGSDDWASRDHLVGTPGVIGDGAQAGPAGFGQQISVPFGPAGPGAVPDGGSTMAFLGLTMLAVGTLRRTLRR